MKSLWLTLLMVLFPVSFLQGMTYREFLDSWVGNWRGISTIYDDHDAPLQLVEVEQNFWWEGDVLRGVTQFWSDDGITQSQSQFIRYEDGRLINEVVFNSGNKRLYKGAIEAGFLVWTWDGTGLRFRVASKVVGKGEQKEIQEECHQLAYTDTKSQLRHIVTRLNLKNEKEVSLPKKIPDLKELKTQ